MLTMRTSLMSFFFSSRRRHTIWPRDWSSDVCSSDLRRPGGPAPDASDVADRTVQRLHRSEERRVGKECRPWWVLSLLRKLCKLITKEVGALNIMQLLLLLLLAIHASNQQCSHLHSDR